MSERRNADTSITIIRKFNVPVEKVYAAWTDPQQLMQWFGPGEVTCKQAEIDFQVGGQYRVHMVTENGEHIVLGEYKEIIPNQKLQFTWAWMHDDSPETLVTLTFKENAGTTTLTLLHEHFVSKESADRHHYGHSGGLDKLEKILS